MNIALYASKNIVDMVFEPRHLARLAELGNFSDCSFTDRGEMTREQLHDVEIIVSSWGMPKMTEEFLDAVPNLKAVFYAAGTVKGFVTDEMYKRGIVLSSAAPANAVPVSEYTIGVILLANKRFFEFMRKSKHHGFNLMHEAPGNYRRTIGIISASMVGRDVMRLLQQYDLNVLLYDPYVTPEQAVEMGATKVELQELMAQSDVVSLHAPNLPNLRHMINAELLALMKEGATFINTARGALVDEAALIAELQARRIYAVLDVTDPEPPVADSPFYTLPNAIYTPHIAGSMNPECARMADFALAELERYLAGEPLQNAVKQEVLAILA